MKVIFLDIDGVLNSIESMLVLRDSNIDCLCPIRIGMVKRLCEEAGAKIVVSSSWRCPTLYRTKESMQRAGADALLPFIIDQTPRIAGTRARTRGHEIAAWLEKNKPEIYVILDDDGDMLPGQFFVHTSMACGFSLDNYLDALEILAPGHPDLSPLRGLAPYRGRWKREVHAQRNGE